MIEWGDARKLAHATGRDGARATERVALVDAAGRTLAAALHSLGDLPGFSSAAMDGWAVAGAAPWKLGAPVFAGDAPAGSLAPGTARAIATGGPVPAGATGVLRAEHGTVDSALGLLDRNSHARPGEPRAGEHVRSRAEEAGAGELLAAAGGILTPPRIALAAVAGHDTLEVVCAPTVDLVLLGSEIVGSGIPLPGQVRDAFGPQLPTVLSRLGLEPGRLRREPDALDATIAAFASSDADVLVSTGGSARGPADHVRAALEAIGAIMVVDGVNVRPGHPVILAVRPDGRPILSLPGNPLAAMLMLASLGAPLVAGLLGQALAPLGTTRLAGDVPNPGTHVRLVALSTAGDGAVPTTHQGSGMLRGLADADVVAIIPVGGAPAGEVETLPIPW